MTDPEPDASTSAEIVRWKKKEVIFVLCTGCVFGGILGGIVGGLFPLIICTMCVGWPGYALLTTCVKQNRKRYFMAIIFIIIGFIIGIILQILWLITVILPIVAIILGFVIGLLSIAITLSIYIFAKKI